MSQLLFRTNHPTKSKPITYYFQFGFFSLLMLFFYLTSSQAETITAVSCSQNDVQNAINAANDGDVVEVPAGTCTWSNSVSILDKTIVFTGAGSQAGGTNIVHGGGDYELVRINPGTKTGQLEVTGFRFSGGCAGWNGCAMTFYGPDGWKNLRIHHNVFDGNYPWTMKGGSNTHGLIDNNTFTGTAFGIMLYGKGADDWASPLTLGTADFFFIEDNVFDFDDFYGSTSAPAMDMNAGGRQVFRHNTLTYGFWETHDKARSGLASANAYEIYHNTITRPTGTTWKGLDVSAGTGVIWGNDFQGDFSVPIGAIDYKSFDPRGLALCDGNDPADQNTPGESGWRCQYQIGSMGEGSTAYGYPLYVWGNTANNLPIGMLCTDGCHHLQEGRDFINSGSTPKPDYVPYIYPHPLQDITDLIFQNGFEPAPII